MPAQDAKLNWGPMHVNSNLIAAIEIRTDGRNILEFCAVPVNHSYERHKKLPPFHIKMRPSWAVDLKVAKLSKEVYKAEYATAILDQVDGRTQFERWCEDIIKLKANKKIMPLTFHWSNKQPVIAEWLGESFKDLVHPQVRDLASLQPFVQDRADFWGGEADIKSTEINAAFNFLHVELDRNDIPMRALAIIEAYQKLLKLWMPGYYPK